MSRKIRIKGLTWSLPLTGPAKTAEVYRVFMAEGLKCYSKSGLQLLCKIAKRFLQLESYGLTDPGFKIGAGISLVQRDLKEIAASEDCNRRAGLHTVIRL